MRRILTAAALAAAALSLAGCSFAQPSATDGSSVQPMPGAPESDRDSGSSSSSDGGGLVADDEATADREIITTGWLTVVTEEPTDAARSATDIVERAGGRVDSRQEQVATDTEAARATLTLRIPADRLTAVLEDLKELGDARETSISTDDVTVVTQDLDARITALQASVDRLLALLERATDTTALVQVESALSQRQSELEGLQAQRRYYAEQVSLSTITLYLVSERIAEPRQPGDFWSGVLTGWDALVAFLAGTLVVIGVALPWLVLAAVILVAVWLIVRAAGRRRSGPVEQADAEERAASPSE